MVDVAATAEEKKVLRELARRVAEIAAVPEMAERRAQWARHNRMAPGRPMIYINPQGSWEELLPASQFRCTSNWAHRAEWTLRSQIYCCEHFDGDNVCDARWVVRKLVRTRDWGLEQKWRGAPAHRGAGTYEPVVHTRADIEKLHPPTVEYDEQATLSELAAAHEAFDGLLEVSLDGVSRPWYHLMAQYCNLRGLDRAMMDMVDDPQMVHDAMRRLTEAHNHVMAEYIRHDLLGLNNDNTPIYTAGYGYSDDLPADGFNPARVRPRDMWCWAQAQEMAVVSPEMHEEFVFQYEKRLLAPFGLTGYGCCDDLTRKLRFVLTIPNLRRVSICPWADVVGCAEQLGDKVIFMWKPQPAMLVGAFNAERVGCYIRKTVDAARANGCTLEMSLLDTHTCENHPERFEAWAQIAREEVGRW